MDNKPPFGVNVESKNERHIVTVSEGHGALSRKTFSSRQKADEYAEEQHGRLSGKYAAMGIPHSH